MIIFDMDGVIFEGNNFWLDLHHEYDTAEEALKLAQKYLSIKHSQKKYYRKLSKKTIKNLWFKKDATKYYNLIESRKFQPKIRQLFSYIKSRCIKTAIVSSGSYDLALKAQKELQIDIIYANKLIVDSSFNFIVDVDVMVDDNNKDKIGKKLVKKYNIPLENMAFIGDSDTDISLAKIVKLPISYNSSSERLKQICQFNLMYGEIDKVIEILENYLDF